MDFKCKNCAQFGEVDWSINPIKHPSHVCAKWIQDQNGLNWTLIICLDCGTLHYCVGDSLFSGVFNMFRGRAPFETRHTKAFENLREPGSGQYPSGIEKAIAFIQARKKGDK